MKSHVRIEQAIYGGQDRGGYRFLARSAGFRDDWLADAERVCTGFGERPAGVACPLAVFALPLNRGQVAVVQVADQGQDDTGRPGALAFRLLALPRRLYADLGGDPFRVADVYPPPWEARGELPALEWTGGPPPHRGVEQVRAILDVPHSATLLGGVQALLDGGKLVFERGGPEPRLVRDLWALLPVSARGELWPASFAFENHHAFHALVTPRADVPGFEDYFREDHLGDYPEGTYEHALQVAAEHRDQEALDGLFGRRSRSQMIRLGLLLLGGFGLAALILARPPEKPAAVTAPTTPTAPVAREVSPSGPQLPPVADVPTLKPEERDELAQRLRRLEARLGIEQPAVEARTLTASLAALDAWLDRRGPERTCGVEKLADLGPPQRQLRALLWKWGVPEYAEPGLRPVELVERLETQLVRKGILRE